MKIVADEHVLGLADAIGNQADLIQLPVDKINNDVLKAADALLCRSTLTINEELIHNTTLNFIGSCVAGLDHVDLDAIKNAGIHFAHAKGCNAVAVRDYVLITLAHLDLLLTPSKIAIIGVGEIGSRLANTLQQLGHELVLCDPFNSDIKHTPLEKIQDCDVLTVHVPLTKAGEYPTFHMLDEAWLRQQAPKAVLINAARADVISEADLLSFAKTNRVCLDVYHHEPTIAPEILEAAHFATPHIAGHSIEGKKRGTAMMYAEMAQRFGLSEYDFGLCSTDIFLPEDIEMFKKLIPLASFVQLLRNADIYQCRRDYPQRHDLAIRC